MRIIFIVIFCVYSFTSYAQIDRTLYINKIKTICPSADVIEMEAKDDFVEIEYLCEEQIYEVGLSYDLNILYTETETTIDNAALHLIQKKLNKKFFGWTIDEFALVEMHDTSFYKVEVLLDGVEENIYFTLKGKYYKTKNMVLNESWNIASLKKNEWYKHTNYQLTRPVTTYEMPEILKEISGIAVLNDTDIFCVQDEVGIVFRYNIQKNELTDIYKFTDIGDFEDITIQNNTLNVLRSDGTIFSFDYKNYTGESASKILPLKCMNIEGLFFDHASNQFLVACKDQLINEESSKRHVFSMNASESAEPKVEFVIDLKDINNYLKKHYHEIYTKIIKLNPSAIAVHPITRETYILSASNRLLAIYNQGQLKDVYPLAEELFYKPEGISFNEKGDMYIATEGNKKEYVGGQIHCFAW